MPVGRSPGKPAAAQATGARKKDLGNPIVMESISPVQNNSGPVRIEVNSKLLLDLTHAKGDLSYTLSVVHKNLKELEQPDPAVFVTLRRQCNLVISLLEEARVAVAEADERIPSSDEEQNFIRGLSLKIESAERKVKEAENRLMTGGPRDMDTLTNMSEKSSFQSQVEIVTQQSEAAAKLKFTPQRLELEKMELELKQRREVIDAQMCEEKARMTTAALDNLERKFASTTFVPEPVGESQDWRTKCLAYDFLTGQPYSRDIKRGTAASEPHIPVVLGSGGFQSGALSREKMITEEAKIYQPSGDYMGRGPVASGSHIPVVLGSDGFRHGTTSREKLTVEEAVGFRPSRIGMGGDPGASRLHIPLVLGSGGFQHGAPSRGDLTTEEAMGFQPSGKDMGSAPGASGLNIPVGLGPGGFQHGAPSKEALKSEDVKMLTESLAGMTRRLMLPGGAPVVFSGEKIIDFMPFKAAFQECVYHYCTTDQERYQFLLKYTSGEAREVVSSCFRDGSSDSFRMAMEELEEEYGRSFDLARHYQSTLEGWPAIAANDGCGLRKYSRHLQSIKNMIGRSREFRQFDQPAEMKIVLEKLPSNMKYKFREVAHRLRKQNGDVTFRDLADFVKLQAEIVNEPIFDCDIERRPSSKRGVVGQPQSRDIRQRRAFVTRTKSSPFNSSASQISREKEETPKDSVLYCKYCKGVNHEIQSCRELLKRPWTEKLEVIRVSGLCFRCLKFGHLRRDCHVKVKCERCESESHNTVMHKEIVNNPIGPREQDDCEDSEEEVRAFRVGSGAAVISPSISVRVVSCGGASLTVGVALDSWASASFMSRELANRLNLCGMTTTIDLTTMTNKGSMEVEVVPKLVVGSLKGEEYTLKNVYVMDPWPFSGRVIPEGSWIEEFSHLKGFPKIRHEKIDILVGNNEPGLVLPIETVAGLDSEPYAVRFKLGWAVCGPFQDKVCRRQAKVVCHASTVDNQIDELLNNLYRQDFEDPFPTVKAMSSDDKLWLSKVSSSIIKLPNHKYQIALPFRNNDVKMPNNWHQALAAMNQLAKKFRNNEEFARDYVGFMEKNIRKGYMVEVPADELRTEPGGVWYMIHHGIYHKMKNKIRVVFDCSRESAGVSLNKMLLPGPDLLNSLLGILIRFRESRFAVLGDIQEMFMQIKVPKEHQDFMRVLWWPTGKPQERVRQYRLESHTFGAVSSPSIANFVVKRAAKEAREIVSIEACEALYKNTYMDDVICSVNSEASAIRVLDEIMQVTRRVGFQLMGITSNCRAVLDTVPRECLSKNYECINFSEEGLPVERALGVVWMVQEDQFAFKINIGSKPLTRRGVLSVTSSIFDPLGLVAPALLPAKVIFQETCREKLGWDEKLPQHLVKRWKDFISQISGLESYRVSRWIGYEGQEQVEMHLFCDGSLTAYAAVAYARTVGKNGNVKTTLLMSKTRQTPLNGTALRTIPRIELNAAKLAVTLAMTLKREMTVGFARTYYWTDSQTVLKYIRSDNQRLLTFVENRVTYIRSNSNVQEWYFVPGKANIADIASRGMNVHEFIGNNEWNCGPSFLSCANFVTFEEPCPAVEADLEIKAMAVTLSEDRSPMTRIFESSGSFLKVKGRVATFVRLLKGLKDKKWVSGPFSVDEYKVAEYIIYKYEQNRYFGNQIDRLRAGQKLNKRDMLSNCSPFLDDEGLLRAHGRLAYSEESSNYKYPIILPVKSIVISSMIYELHRKMGHMGRSYMTAELQQNFYIPRLTRILKSIANLCLICRKLNGRVVFPKMAPLPDCRVVPQQKAFWVTGLDFFGPFALSYGRGTSSRQRKCYGMVASCMASRAVHIEVVETMSLDCFLNAFRRFVARRGQVNEVHCDNGTNLRGGAAELKRHFDEWNKSEFTGKMAAENIKWEFNPPLGSNFGGVWERDIRSIRKVLASLCNDHEGYLTGDVMRTLMCEVEAILNNRPITPVSSFGVDLGPLTPAHILLTKPVLHAPTIHEDVNKYTAKRWKYIQHLADIFWTRWLKEYVPGLLMRQKWINDRENPEVGDLVMLVDKSAPRNTWPMGIIHEVHLSGDSVVRRVVVKVATPRGGKSGAPTAAFLVRPVNKLIPVLKVGK